MKEISLEIVKASYEELQIERNMGFELFGLDFMLDDKNTVYLIEVIFLYF